MDKIEAEKYVYQSYLNFEKKSDYLKKDCFKRNPELTRKLLREKSKTPCVVVTGSKGKGSVSNIISNILAVKYRIGLMTSPHIKDFCERFKINGEKINEDDFVEYMGRVKEEIEVLNQNVLSTTYISPIGIQADLALQYFYEKQTDFNIFECGKGAKYDDVNNIVHDYAIINTIFLEHTRELGDSLEEIAADKACVINGEQKCVYIAEQKENVMNIIKTRAERYSTKIKIYGRDFWAENIHFTNQGMIFDAIIEKEKYCNINIPLLGEHQVKNCVLAMALCKDIFKEIDINKLKENLECINCEGRLEIISKNPFIILDACINRESCLQVKKVLKEMGIDEIVAIIGIPSDKDFKGVINEMENITSHLIMTKSSNPHYIFPEKEYICREYLNRKFDWENSVEKAIVTAEKYKKPIVILGTTSIISDVKNAKILSKYYKNT